MGMRSTEVRRGAVPSSAGGEWAPGDLGDELPGRPNPLRRMVEIYHENAWLLAERESLLRRVRKLDSLGRELSGIESAYLDWLRAKRSGALALLRSNRRELRSILQQLAVAPAPAVECGLGVA